MTLGDFFQALSENPAIVCFLFVSMPLTAFLASIFGKNEGAVSPWKELYSSLVYLTCIPGIFAITLNVYLFLFERQPINDINLFTQVLPIISMVLTLWLIRKNVRLDQVPGFEKLGGLIMILFALIVFMWILEKTHIFAITFIPFSYFVILFVVLLVGIRFGLRRIFK
ncbi:MAG: hypothetical protein ACJA1A_001007 [Saprospiraceae bacterium]|jgi:hypothetical protein|tara:strand:- start:4278 stop:4781 length:504 start_codon:yes stop_codon:yes gene_type:complete